MPEGSLASGRPTGYGALVGAGAVVVVTGGWVVIVAGGWVVVVGGPPRPPWWWRWVPNAEAVELKEADWNARRLPMRAARGWTRDRDVPPARWCAISACAPGPVVMTARPIAAPSAASWLTRPARLRVFHGWRHGAWRRREARPRAGRAGSCVSVVTPSNVASRGNRTLDATTTSGQLTSDAPHLTHPRRPRHGISPGRPRETTIGGHASSRPGTLRR